MAINTYCNIPNEISSILVLIAKKGLIVTLFLIGTSLSIKSIKKVGIRPLLLAITLWIVIGVTSFFVVKHTIN